ncbi:hypothetical protein EZS27_030843 [termite gut metagenome]|uniref:Uncharacterized protein n=1 Tax=termite gut metagenome TaxID=433724 RepID=A0A5J4QEG6_9ZZZZ
MNIENVDNETFHNDGKSKRRRKPKADKQEYRYMVRLNKANKRQISVIVPTIGNEMQVPFYGGLCIE